MTDNQLRFRFFVRTRVETGLVDCVDHPLQLLGWPMEPVRAPDTVDSPTPVFEDAFTQAVAVACRS